MPGSVPSVEVTALPDDAVLLDVREPDEWTAGHAPNAKHLPLGELAARQDEIGQAASADDTVYVVCRAGSRSARATQALVQAGVQAVNVEGGMTAWHASGKPMVSEDGRPPEVA